MGREFGRGLGENTQVTTPGGLGLWRGPLGLGFQAGRGAVWRSELAYSHWYFFFKNI
ncbi:hypothetical protein Hdeb2414_s0019g00544551 [Helianthus debilis subsp. tardiflorus]